MRICVVYGAFNRGKLILEQCVFVGCRDINLQRRARMRKMQRVGIRLSLSVPVVVVAVVAVKTKTFPYNTWRMNKDIVGYFNIILIGFYYNRISMQLFV